MWYLLNNMALLLEDLYSTQLLLAMNDLTKALDDGHSVDILYFDFAN